ncbi:MAG: hypothetical protein J5449_07380, partial [Oscillospiraceae bacterium]|nr:hypothetical protein [Oscillospiraceae bacterium]
ATARQHAENVERLTTELRDFEASRAARNLQSGGTRLVQTANRLDSAYDSLSARGDQHLAAARRGQDSIGRGLSDVLTVGTQMLGDAAANAVVPGAGLAMLGTRAFGDASQQARKSGAGVGEQIGCGIGVGATELLTEKMLDGLGGIYGRGMADDAVNGLIGRLAKTPSGRDTLHALASMGSEAAEEIAAGVIEPAFESIYNGRNVRENYSADTAADILHDAMIGGFFGLLGGTVGKHIRSDLADVQTRYDATLRALADPSATAEQRARLAQSTADMADWASRRLDELAPANARQAAAQTQRALADIAEQMKPLTLDETGEPIIDPLGTTEVSAKKSVPAELLQQKPIYIGKSVGARAKNYLVIDKETGIAYHLVEGTHIENPTVFAGYKGAKPLNPDTKHGLVSEFGGDAEKWQHAKGIGVLDVGGEDVRAEIHWFQEENVGKVKFKVKRWLE